MANLLSKRSCKNIVEDSKEMPGNQGINIYNIKKNKIIFFIKFIKFSKFCF